MATVSLACDTCGAVRQAPARHSRSLATLRLKLRAVGWLTDGEVDTCQACVVGATPATELRVVR